MTEKEKVFLRVVEAIFELPQSPVNTTNKKESIVEFIKTAVNEDSVREYIVIDVMLGSKLGVYVYILTDTRFIQIGIDGDQQIDSRAFALHGIINVERKLIGEDKMTVQLVFKDNTVGIDYSAKNSKITEFFQKVEQVWASEVEDDRD